LIDRLIVGVSCTLVEVWLGFFWVVDAVLTRYSFLPYIITPARGFSSSRLLSALVLDALLLIFDLQNQLESRNDVGKIK
jgi:hypothetical protein